MSTQASLKLIDNEDVGQKVPDGYLVTNDQLAKLGAGDIKYGRKMLRMLLVDLKEPKVRQGPTVLPDTVKIAGPDDELEVTALILRQVSRQAAHIIPICVDRILESVQAGTRQRGGIVGVIRLDQKVVAATVLVPIQSAVSKAYYLSEVFDVVHPDHRRSRHAEDLMQFGHWASDEMSRRFGYVVPYVATVVSDPGDKLLEKLRFYRRRMVQIGATFAYPFPIVR